MLKLGRLFAGLGIGALLLVKPSFATILTFDGLGLSREDPIPASYGDRSAGTPNVVVDYFTRNATTNDVEDPFLRFWDTAGAPSGGISPADSYGDLVNVAYPASDGAFAEIVLTPDSGFVVVLEGFRMAGFPRADIDTDVFVSDGRGFVQIANQIQGRDPFPGAPGSHSSFSLCVASSSPVTIRWGTTFNAGIDDIEFRQIPNTETVQCESTPVPEPATLGLLGFGLVGLVWSQRRRALRSSMSGQAFS